jgi:hypothetical protein
MNHVMTCVIVGVILLTGISIFINRKEKYYNNLDGGGTHSMETESRVKRDKYKSLKYQDNRYERGERKRN